MILTLGMMMRFEGSQRRIARAVRGMGESRRVVLAPSKGTVVYGPKWFDTGEKPFQTSTNSRLAALYSGTAAVYHPDEGVIHFISGASDVHGTTTKTWLTFDPKTGVWVDKTPGSFPAASFASAVYLDGAIYAALTPNTINVPTPVWKYQNGSWEYAFDPATGSDVSRTRFKLVTDGEKIYIFGANFNSTNNRYTVMQTYDEVNGLQTLPGTWDTSDVNPPGGVLPQDYGTPFIKDGVLYILACGNGAYAGYAYSLKYSLTTNTWSTVAGPTDLQGQRTGYSHGVLNGQLFISDGVTCLIFDPIAATYTATLDEPNGNHSTSQWTSTVVDDVLYNFQVGSPGIFQTFVLDHGIIKGA